MTPGFHIALNIGMKAIFLPLLSIILVGTAFSYEVPGAKPLEKLEAEQAKAKSSKKLFSIVYKGRHDTCPYCEDAAATGAKAIRGVAESIVVTEDQVKDPAAIGKLPAPVQAWLKKQPTNAWVAFGVFDPEMTTLIASIGRNELNGDKKVIREFTDKIKAAKDEAK